MCVQLLNSGACAVRCDSPPGLYLASVYFALQLICGATGGSFHRGAFNTQEQVRYCHIPTGHIGPDGPEPETPPWPDGPALMASRRSRVWRR